VKRAPTQPRGTSTVPQSLFFATLLTGTSARTFRLILQSPACVSRARRFNRTESLTRKRHAHTGTPLFMIYEMHPMKIQEVHGTVELLYPVDRLELGFVNAIE
jgi:hypothetical protein